MTSAMTTEAPPSYESLFPSGVSAESRQGRNRSALPSRQAHAPQHVHQNQNRQNLTGPNRVSSNRRIHQPSIVAVQSRPPRRRVRGQTQTNQTQLTRFHQVNQHPERGRHWEGQTVSRPNLAAPPSPRSSALDRISLENTLRSGLSRMKLFLHDLENSHEPGREKYIELLKDIQFKMEDDGRHNPRGGTIRLFSGRNATYAFQEKLESHEKKLLQKAGCKLEKRVGTEASSLISMGPTSKSVWSLDLIVFIKNLERIDTSTGAHGVKKGIDDAFKKAVVSQKIATADTPVNISTDIMRRVSDNEWVVKPYAQSLSVTISKPVGNDLSKRPSFQNKADRNTAIRRLARGLDSIHQMGVVLRNIDPSHIVFTKEGDPRSVAFGNLRRAELADAYDNQLHGQYTVERCGSPCEYEAPELALRHLLPSNDPGKKADIYAFGVTICHIVGVSIPRLASEDRFNTSAVALVNQEIQNKIQSHSGLTVEQKNILSVMLGPASRRPALLDVARAFRQPVTREGRPSQRPNMHQPYRLQGYPHRSQHPMTVNPYSGSYL